MTAPNAAATEARTMRYQVIGMDCPDDIAAIEKTARAVAGIAEAHVSLASHAMTVRSAAGLAPLSELERAVSGLGFRLDRHEPRGDGGAAPLTSSHIAPGSKRARWIVVTLNLGYGVVEMIGGFLSGSQAVKADALDFIGDGLISFLGLLALGWYPVWRARAALVQGLFLGAQGVGPPPVIVREGLAGGAMPRTRPASG